MLPKGNHLSLALIAHASGLQETYETRELVLHLIKYSIYNWNICIDFKIIGLLLGSQMGGTKHQCFLCRWDSRDEKQHYILKRLELILIFFLARFIMFLYLIPPKCLRQYRLN